MRLLTCCTPTVRLKEITPMRAIEPLKMWRACSSPLRADEQSGTHPIGLWAQGGRVCALFGCRAARVTATSHVFARLWLGAGDSL